MSNEIAFGKVFATLLTNAPSTAHSAPKGNIRRGNAPLVMPPLKSIEPVIASAKRQRTETVKPGSSASAVATSTQTGPITVKVKSLRPPHFAVEFVDAQSDDTVELLKSRVAASLTEDQNADGSAVKLLNKGRVLADEFVLGSLGMEVQLHAMIPASLAPKSPDVTPAPRPQATKQVGADAASAEPQAQATAPDNKESLRAAIWSKIAQQHGPAIANAYDLSTPPDATALRKAFERSV
ncbi:hypothetical protein PYCC9005_004016 [Savitreella phatthalungensis]